jgi:hypothetical protein
VNVKEKSTGREYNISHDRRSKPVFSRKYEPKFLKAPDSTTNKGSDSKPLENHKELEKDKDCWRIRSWHSNALDMEES